MRSTRVVHLTDAGQRLVPHARTALRGLEQLDAALAVQHRVLRLGVLDVPIVELEGVLARLNGVVLDTTNHAAPALLDALVGGDVDVVLTRLDGPRPAGTEATLLRLDPVLALVRTNYPSATVAPGNIRTWTFDVSAFWPEFERFQSSFEGAVGAALHRLPLASDDFDRALDINDHLARHPQDAMLTISGNRVLPAGYRTVGLTPLQPYLAWSLLWRSDDRSAAVARFLDAARRASTQERWLRHDHLVGRPWLPPGDPWSHIFAA